MTLALDLLVSRIVVIIYRYHVSNVDMSCVNQEAAALVVWATRKPGQCVRLFVTVTTYPRKIN